MHVDVKVSVWKRIELPESVFTKEQVIGILKKGEEGINDLFDFDFNEFQNCTYKNLSYDEVENSEETLTPEENNYQATIELYDNEECGNAPIWTNAQHFYKPEYPEVISLEWAVSDFESKAQEIEDVYPDQGDEYTEETPMLYDRSKFAEALSLVKQRHDCNYGVTWETIEYFLNEYCKL